MMRKRTHTSILLTLLLTFSFSSPPITSTAPTLTANSSTLLLRFSGTDRYATATAIAKRGWSQSDYAVLAYGENYPDALSAAPLARKYDAPLLLTEKSYLPNTTIDSLVSLKVKNVFIIGGAGVIDKKVEAQLQSLGITFTRLAGQDRYDTSVQVALLVNPNPQTLYIASGEDYSDALSISPIATMQGVPVILVPENYLPNSIKDYLAVKNILKSYVVGHSSIISDKVANQFPNVERIIGVDKYARNISINQRFDTQFKSKQICLASGEDFADALTGAVYAAKISEPIMLVKKEAPSATKNYYQQKSLNAEAVLIFGGTGAVSDDTLAYLSNTSASAPSSSAPSTSTPADSSGSLIWYSGSNRGTYSGEIKNGIPNGEGVWTGDNGDKRTGTWSNGKENGYGIYTWTQEPWAGNHYEGNWSNGAMSGQGTLSYANGHKYVGSFFNGKRNGSGVYYYSTGSSYQGTWKNDFVGGTGTLTTVSNGTFTFDWGSLSSERMSLISDYNAGSQQAYPGIYLGEEKDNIPNGIGYWISLEKGRSYVGDWVNGKRQGHGIYIWPLGEKYDGTWVNGDLNGLGTYSWPNGDMYEGLWENGKANGKGKEVYANKDIYDGQWKNGEPHGQGQKKYANGDTYEGLWENGLAQGYGTYVWAKSGRKYAGTFVNGSLYQGSGVIFDKDNRALETINGNISKPSVVSAASITQTIEQGDNYSLPETVETTYIDGIKKQIGVIWNPANVDTSKIGTFDFTGILSESTDVRATASVVVTPSFTGQIKSISLNKTTLPMSGGSETLITTIIPSNARNQNVTWKSSNSSVINVDSMGRVTAVGNGIAYVTVNTQDGNKTATCEVTVSNMAMYRNLSSTYKTENGLTVRMNRMTKAASDLTAKYTIDYTLINESSELKYEEKNFKMHFTDGSYLNQYGIFASLAPQQVVNRSYEFEVSKARTPYMVEYGAEFFSSKPSADTLHWRIE